MARLLLGTLTVAATLLVAMLLFGPGPRQTAADTAPAAVPIAPDGIDDIFFADRSGSGQVLLSDGGGTFTDMGVGHGGSPNWEYHVGHFDSDGLDDIFYYNADTGDNTILIADGAGGGTQKGVFTWPAGLHIVPGDYNGDGLTDMYRYGGALSDVQFANGDGTWTDGTDDNIVTSGLDTFVSGHFNSDSFDDLFRYGSTTGATQLLYADGTGNWTNLATPDSAPFDTRGLVLDSGDFNNDGLLDLLTTFNDYDVGQTTFKAYVKNSGAGFANSNVALNFPSKYQDAIVGDFTGDSKADVYVYHDFSSHTQVYQVQGGSFSLLNEDDGGLGYAGTYSGRFTADNKTDLLIYDTSGGGYVRIANGDGTWTNGPEIPFLAHWSDVNIGDFGTSPGAPTPTTSPTPTASPSPTPTTTAEPTPTSTLPSELIQGDLTCDGEVTVEDASALLAFVAEHTGTLNDCLTAAVAPAGVVGIGDVNCDSQLDVVDVLDILLHLAGLEEISLGGGCALVGEPLLD